MRDGLALRQDLGQVLGAQHVTQRRRRQQARRVAVVVRRDGHGHGKNKKRQSHRIGSAIIQRPTTSFPSCCFFFGLPRRPPHSSFTLVCLFFLRDFNVCLFFVCLYFDGLFFFVCLGDVRAFVMIMVLGAFIVDFLILFGEWFVLFVFVCFVAFFLGGRGAGLGGGAGSVPLRGKNEKTGKRGRG